MAIVYTSSSTASLGPKTFCERASSAATRKNSIGSDAVWGTAGAIAQSGQAFLLVYLLSQFYPQKDVGQFSMALALVIPLHLFADRALRTLQATTVHDNVDLQSYLGFRAILGFIAILTAYLVGTIWSLDFNAQLTIFLVGLNRFQEGMAQVLYGPLHRANRLDWVGASQVVRAFVNSLTCLLAIFADGGLIGMLASSLVAQSFAIIFVECQYYLRHTLLNENRLLGSASGLGLFVAPIARLKAVFRLEFCQVPWSVMLSSGLPLALATFFVASNTSLPRLFLARTNTESILASFAVASYLAFPVTICVAALMQAAMPRLAKSYRADSTTRHRRLILQLSIACGVMAIFNYLVISLGGHWLLNRFFGQSYQVDGAILNWLAAATSIGFISSVPATTLTARNRYVLSGLSCGLATLCCLFACSLLIPSQGMVGASQAMFITNIFHGLLALTALWYAARPRPTLA